MTAQVEPYRPKHKIRVVTAASLFDGHDAAINVMRRIIQASGAEVIHLGHDRSAQEVVECAIQEDANAIAMTSYQGGHMEYFKYMHDLLKERGCGHIRIFGGGGGVILPSEIEALHAYGIARIYSPDDGRAMGLQGMINDMLAKCDFATGEAINGEIKLIPKRDAKAIGRLISAAENFPQEAKKAIAALREPTVESAAPSTAKGKSAEPQVRSIPVVGITGTGGAGKSSLVDELVRRFLYDFPHKTIAIVSVDPTKRRTGGALLGDRIRMNAIHSPRVYMRSLATRQANLALSAHVRDAVTVVQRAGFDLVILETSGIGQGDTEIIDHCDVAMYVMTPEYGAASQLEKIDMLDFADLIALNKCDKRGSADALRDVRKQFKRNRGMWGDVADASLPVFGTIASQFQDPGTDALYAALVRTLNEKVGLAWESTLPAAMGESEKVMIIPPERVRYLSDIATVVRDYNARAEQQAQLAQRWQGLRDTLSAVQGAGGGSPEGAGITEGTADPALQQRLEALAAEAEAQLDGDARKLLEEWPKRRAAYEGDVYAFKVRGKSVEIATYTESLSEQKIPKVALPRYRSDGDTLHWLMQENLPGAFPYTAGVFPFKREGEDPTRMFAGEGGPERTNRRFHYVSRGLPASRLSTAFDSVTLYGADPDHRPDIYGKIGNAGVSVCCLDDAKKLYSGFDLCAPTTSVSMTINGPAPTLLAFFMNAAIDQQCERYIREQGLTAKAEKAAAALGDSRPVYQGDLPPGHNGLGLLLLGITGEDVLAPDVYARIKGETLKQVRGTVQADILKEDQAQNTCIFSTEFSLRVMGDVQAYFIDNDVRNFYSVSISGYHIAEAGANPITQLAFTLANGFTYVEYYVSRGMPIDAFAPNLSFFFSNGIDPEYAVLGRVARRIWAKAMRYRYGAGSRSQKLKYHIQTSGRSLHAQEIEFNDIRTTLQALYGIIDNCNSLHTNAYDEAITTPTEASVRRALAIQMIINHEFGLAKNQNPWQGSFFLEALTDLVEEAVLQEFDRLTERGGVLGAMETMYQRGKIQEESLHYETLKHSGAYPIIGVNTFLSSEGSPTVLPGEVIRSTNDEKEGQIQALQSLHGRQTEACAAGLRQLQQTAMAGGNVFDVLMDVAKHCSLGQITQALFEVGGRYRRSM